MKTRILLVGVLLVAEAGVLFSQAQEPTPARLEINVVNVPLIVTVTDSKGQLITGLKKEAFKILEDARPQKTQTFAHETDLPLSIVLLVDISSSTFSQLEFERQAARDFFSKVLKTGKDRAAIVGFESKPILIADFTDDQSALTAGLKKLSAGGSSGVYDAVYEAVDKKLSKEAGERRKVVILISDGFDTASNYSLMEATEKAQKNDALIYAISVNKISNSSKDERRDGDKAIKQLTEETGGKAFYPEKLTELGAEFAKIEEELRSQYVLSYIPMNPFNGTYRKIRVDMSDRKFKAKTRSGYYATK